MMHSNGFVVCVKDQNRKVLREIGGKVFLPFQSEYSVLLKNNNTIRCCCSVSIDGTDVLGGTELIIPSFCSIDLERFIVDGDLNKGNRFKFVPLSDSRVSDPSNPENGLIEVKFWKENDDSLLKIYETGFPGYPQKWPDTHPWMPRPHSIYYTSCSSKSSDSFGEVKCFNSSLASPGATVEGSISGQSFTYGKFGTKDGDATIIHLTLVGRNEPLTVKDTRHIFCTRCGQKSAFGNKFCSGCGKKLHKAKLELQH